MYYFNQKFESQIIMNNFTPRKTVDIGKKHYATENPTYKTYK